MLKKKSLKEKSFFYPKIHNGDYVKCTFITKDSNNSYINCGIVEYVHSGYNIIFEPSSNRPLTRLGVIKNTQPGYSAKYLYSKGLDEIKIIRKSDYTKALKSRNSLLSEFGDWKVEKKGDIYVFGCGAVQLTQREIKDFLEIENILNISNFSNDYNVQILNLRNKLYTFNRILNVFLDRSAAFHGFKNEKAKL